MDVFMEFMRVKMRSSHFRRHTALAIWRCKKKTTYKESKLLGRNVFLLCSTFAHFRFEWVVWLNELRNYSFRPCTVNVCLQCVKVVICVRCSRAVHPTHDESRAERKGRAHTPNIVCMCVQPYTTLSCIHNLKSKSAHQTSLKGILCHPIPASVQPRCTHNTQRYYFHTISFWVLVVSEAEWQQIKK